VDKVFAKGLNVLEMLVASDEPRRLTDLADDLGLAKSNIHRILKTLVHRGYVRQDPTSGRYECTLKLWQLGVTLGNRIQIKPVAHPHLLILADETTETVHLSVLEGFEVIYIDKIDSPHPVRAYSVIGGHAPAHCVATGKALLAFSPAASQSHGRLEKFTNRTITDFQELQEELSKVREQGYAINRGEWRETVCGLAAPVFDASQKVCAAIGISGPHNRLTLARMRDLAPNVLKAAAAISSILGYKGGLTTKSPTRKTTSKPT
jgi:IclR family transcriptional regulator, KDG regulon repressor